MTIKPLSPSLRALLERAVASYEANVGLALDYLGARGISPETAARHRLGVVAPAGSSGERIPGHEPFQGRLAIPGLGREGKPYSLRFRAMGGEEGPKYLGLPGVPTRLYNIRAIHEATQDFMVVCEGELDTIIAGQCGLPAVGVTGASNWKVHHPRMLAGFSTVYVCGDGDKAGKDFTARVTDSMNQAVAVTLPEGMDITDVYLASGEAGVRDLIGLPGRE